jgi:hypothetical protein
MSMHEATQINFAIGENPYAAGQLLPLVYDQLRRLVAAILTQEKPGQRLGIAACASLILHFVFLFSKSL